jgi:enamine deaminase RidA (YjgF/YER057c/UK114 family)
MTIAARLADLGIELPPVFPAAGKYEPLVVVGDLAFVSGHGPAAGDRTVQGKVGAELSLEEGKQAARMTGLSILATLQAELGDLDRVARIVKVLGMVNAVPEFEDHPKAINGCSDLFVQVFAERGKHARSAVGMGSLPMGIPVEIECVVEVE